MEGRRCVYRWRSLGGELEFSTMHLTCIGASERPHTEVRAGAERSYERDAMDGRRCVDRWRSLGDSNPCYRRERPAS